MLSGSTQRVAIVGGGAAGALTAVHLLREPRERGALEIDLIDRSGSFGTGVAYGTTDPLHLLNVPAVRMGAIADHPEHFHQWLAARGETIAEAAFLPRGLYGAYLRDLLASAERDAGLATVRRHEADVIGVTERPESALELTLDDGERLEADRVVLALGPLDGGDPISVPAEIKESGVYVGDPWASGALDAARRDRSVLIVGTGLTMVDVSLSLGSEPNGPRMLAVSRHGLVPRRHRRTLTTVRHFPIPTDSGRLDPIVTAIIGQISRVSQQGDDWRDVVDSIRPVTPALWKSLIPEEKRRFIAEMHRLWDVHRYRMAPDVADRFEALQEAGRIRAEADSIVSVEPYGAGARVSMRTPGSHDLDTVEVDRVINCSGAGIDLRRNAPPLLAALLASGRARPDELGMGLDIGEDGALLSHDGAPSDRLFAVGALRRGVEWEALGVTEIRDHAGAVARRIVAAGERQPLRPAELRHDFTVPPPRAEAA